MIEVWNCNYLVYASGSGRVTVRSVAGSQSTMAAEVCDVDCRISVI
jgi:hypothetical protein